VKKQLLSLIVVSFSLLMAIVPVQAQEGYRLRTPSAGEFLSLLTELAPLLTVDPSSAFFNDSLSKISGVLFYLYPDVTETTFETLLTAYTANEIGNRENVFRDKWVQQMVEAWLSENLIDLSAVSVLRFEDFFIQVIPRDFDNDGVNEYVLDVAKGEPVNRTQDSCLSAELSAYFVVQQKDGGYQFIETGLPWKGYALNGRYSYSNGGMIELRFGDLNADELPEWVVVVGGETAGGPGMGYADGGGLIILGWRNGQLEYLAPSSYASDRPNRQMTTDFFSTEGHCAGPFPAIVAWEFTNIDDDPALEILQSQQYIDNWSCSRTETRFFDWDASVDRYRYTETQTQYTENTQNCVQRQAEEIMWTGDYAAAIPVFERALTLETDNLSSGEGFNYERSLNQYLRARLAFAYIMTGQGRLAERLLDELAREEIEEEPISKFIDILRSSRGNATSPLQLCVSAYNLFTTDFLNIRVGFTGDERYYDNNPYLPERIACDAPAMLQATLIAQPIPADIPPSDYLADLGITTVRSMETDMDGDGRSEWLVWPDVAGTELFFVPDGEVYNVSYQTLDPYGYADDLREWPLPSGTDTAIALLRFKHGGIGSPPWRFAYNYAFGAEGGGPPVCKDGTMPGEFSLWQAREGGLSRIFYIRQCVHQFEDILPNGQAGRELRFRVAECIDLCNESREVEEVYEWDEGQQTYVRAFPPTPTMLETPTPFSTPTPSPYPQYYDVLDAFIERDFDAVVGMTSESLAVEPESNLDTQLGDKYLRALALEALNRSNEALAEYVAIYEAAPDSPWGQIAALHFERVE
jgi:hypothetical protein